MTLMYKKIKYFEMHHPVKHDTQQIIFNKLGFIILFLETCLVLWSKRFFFKLNTNQFNEFMSKTGKPAGI